MFPCTPPHLSYPTLLAFTCVGSSTLLISSWVGWVGGWGAMLTSMYTSTLVTCYATGFYLCLLFYFTYLFLGWVGWGAGVGFTCIYTSTLVTCYATGFYLSALRRYFISSWGGVGCWRSCTLPHLSHATLLAFTCVCSSTLLISSWGGVGGVLGGDANVHIHFQTCHMKSWKKTGKVSGRWCAH